MKIAVVGGGLIGLASAAELASAGHEVTIFDAAPEAREASWAAAGMLAPYHECDTDGPLYRFTVAALDSYAAILRDHGIAADEVDLRVDGSWIPLLDAEDEAEIRHKEAFLRSLAVPTERIDRDQLQREEPGLDAQGALRLPGGQVNPRLLSERYRERCITLGVTLRYRSVVTRIHHGVISVDGTDLPFERIVLASGAWTPALAAATGLALEGEPVKGQLLRLAAPDGVLKKFVHCRHAYLVPRRGDGTVGDSIVVGATMVHSGFDKREDADAIAQLASNARRLLPELTDAPIVETWTGLRPRLRSGLPCIAQIREDLIVATGHYRNGILLGPLTARCVAALVDSTEPPQDLSAFTAEVL
jgi:glycine oxidase